MTQTLPQTGSDQRYATNATLAATLRSIATLIDRNDEFADIRLSFAIQVCEAGTATPEQRTAAIENIAGTFDGHVTYSGDIGHYNGTGPQIHVYGRMRPPADVFATMWDEAHAEDAERTAAHIVETVAAADRLQNWFDSHKDCCRGGYRALIDDEHHMAIEWKAGQDANALLDAAVDDLDPDTIEITCGRCAIAVGAHTFGRGCNAKLAPASIAPSGTPKHAARPDLLHLNNPGDIAPGEPDDRGWDAPIMPVNVDQLGASA